MMDDPEDYEKELRRLGRRFKFQSGRLYRGINFTPKQLFEILEEESVREKGYAFAESWTKEFKVSGWHGNCQVMALIPAYKIILDLTDKKFIDYVYNYIDDLLDTDVITNKENNTIKLMKRYIETENEVIVETYTRVYRLGKHILAMKIRESDLGKKYLNSKFREYLTKENQKIFDKLIIRRGHAIFDFTKNWNKNRIIRVR